MVGLEKAQRSNLGLYPWDLDTEMTGEEEKTWAIATTNITLVLILWNLQA